jgi:hypothetical protein
LALDAGEWLGSLPWPHYPLKRTKVRNEYEGGWAPEPIGRFAENSLASTGIRNVILYLNFFKYTYIKVKITLQLATMAQRERSIALLFL